MTFRDPAYNVTVAETDAEIAASFPVMAQLRPHLKREDYVAVVRRQQRECGYQLAVLAEDNEPRAAAGYRFDRSLAWGETIYVYDLVTDAAHRGRGFGSALIEWLSEQASKSGCGFIHLDSGVQRNGAHRFYLRQRFDIRHFHFTLDLRGTKDASP